MKALLRDTRHEWPDDAPIGTFDITDRDDGKFILFICPNGQRCGVDISEAPRGTGDPPEWGWDGNYDAPTLTPSINCIGGCGWHGFITKGEFA